MAFGSGIRTDQAVINVEKLTLSLLPEKLAVCRLESKAPLPGWLYEQGNFVSVTKTADETSVVCSEAFIPAGVPTETGFRALKVEGPLDFALTGILAGILSPLSRAGIAVFVLSTYDTDYVLVKTENLQPAIELLSLSCRIKA